MKRPQLKLVLPHARTHGGRRDGVGRPLSTSRKGLPHRSRPFHDRKLPVHVTWRLRDELPSLRRPALARIVGRAIRKNTEGQLARQTSFRVLHFSVQPDHLHLIVEAGDRRALTAGLRGLAVWIARKVNGQLGTRGNIVRDRYHERPLRTPREVRGAIVYVLQNHRHHVRAHHRVDPWSSAAWFDGWAEALPPPLTSSPVIAPKTWLAKAGWRRFGLIDLDEAPA